MVEKLWKADAIWFVFLNGTLGGTCGVLAELFCTDHWLFAMKFSNQVPEKYSLHSYMLPSNGPLRPRPCLPSRARSTGEGRENRLVGS